MSSAKARLFGAGGDPAIYPDLTYTKIKKTLSSKRNLSGEANRFRWLQ